MKLTVNTSPTNREAKFTIRLEPIFLLLEVLKIYGYISWSWLTFILIFTIPWLICKTIQYYIKRYMRLNNIPIPEKK